MARIDKEVYKVEVSFLLGDEDPDIILELKEVRMAIRDSITNIIGTKAMHKIDITNTRDISTR
jgi:hypothetical protein